MIEFYNFENALALGIIVYNKSSHFKKNLLQIFVFIDAKVLFYEALEKQNNNC